jgi:hypothetical protein
MPYVPPHLRPGYIPLEQRPGYVAPVVKTGTRFPTNMNNLAKNVKANNGTRYSPKRNAVPKKGALKTTRKISPNAKAPKSPSHAIDNWAPKFRNYVKGQLAEREAQRRRNITVKIGKKDKKAKKSRKQTRKSYKPKRLQSKKGKRGYGKK